MVLVLVVICGALWLIVAGPFSLCCPVRCLLLYLVDPV